MLQMRPNCERCDTDLPADQPGAVICTFECTWCDRCNEVALKGVCPNCKGDLMPRPTRSLELLKKFPASTERIMSS